jgi:hypothetical protein
LVLASAIFFPMYKYIYTLLLHPLHIYPAKQQRIKIVVSDCFHIRRLTTKAYYYTFFLELKQERNKIEENSLDESKK